MLFADLKVGDMTPFQQHVSQWRHCQACDLCHTRKQVVFARGSVPCDILLVGEAPGESENVLGKPFCGPAGKLLDHIISRSIPKEMSYALTNLIACIPRDPEEGGKAAEPEHQSIIACKPRLQQFVRICDGIEERKGTSTLGPVNILMGGAPHLKLIVAVGALARDWLDTKYHHHVALHRVIPRVEIIHPAAILRANIAMRGFAIQKCVVTVQNAIENLQGV